MAWGFVKNIGNFLSDGWNAITGRKAEEEKKKAAELEAERRRAEQEAARQRMELAKEQERMRLEEARRQERIKAEEEKRKLEAERQRLELDKKRVEVEAKTKGGINTKMVALVGGGLALAMILLGSKGRRR